MPLARGHDEFMLSGKRVSHNCIVETSVLPWAVMRKFRTFLREDIVSFCLNRFVRVVGSLYAGTGCLHQTFLHNRHHDGGGACQSYDYESWCYKVMEQHEKTPHKDLEIFVRRERIVKPGGNLPPPETKFNNLKTNLLHTTTGFLTSRKGHALIFVSSPCCFCRRML